MSEQLLTWEDVFRELDELRAMARRLLSLEGSAQTLTPTALVLTALRRQLPKGKDWGDVSWDNRSRFFASMYRSMRQALIDHARARKRKKRQELRAVQLDDLDFSDLRRTAQERPEQIDALMQALATLQARHPGWAEAVEHRFLAGYTIEETARVMGKDERTIRRWWDSARALLYDEILRILNDQTEGPSK